MCPITVNLFVSSFLAAVDKLLNLDSLAIQLKEVSSLWYEIGEQLGIAREILNDIESHYTNVEDRRIEMFAFYLRTEPHPTWSHVAKALRKLHENTLAEKLENSYITGRCVCVCVCVCSNFLL